MFCIVHTYGLCNVFYLSMFTITLERWNKIGRITIIAYDKYVFRFRLHSHFVTPQKTPYEFNRAALHRKCTVARNHLNLLCVI